MLRYLVDPANAVTACGLVFSGLGLFLASSGHLEFAIAAVLWAMLADHLDGVVAKRTRNRAPDTGQIGKSLDGFSDFLYGAIFPAVIVLEAGQTSWLSLLTTIALVLAGAVRLSYFANFGLSSDGRFMGLPLSYDVPLLALVFLVRPWLPENAFSLFLNITFLVVAGLHVASIRVPAARGAMYAIIIAFSVSASAGLLLRGVA
jgi:CDP-diacylglycerol--serine O-phosphatidyltransferase